MSKKSPIFLVDGSSFLYRAYYGMRPLHTSKGIAVQAVYGFCKMIKKLISDFDVKNLILVWDSKGKTNRHEIFEDYKAHRQAPPSDLFEQKELILRFAQLLNIPQIAEIGIEADDLIYSLAEKFSKESHPVVVVSSDKDLAQMVTEKIQMFDPFHEKIMQPKDFEEKYGFPLKKLPFFFALLGDSSDNIPGVKGIGKKGATALVQQFESLQDVYDNIDKVDKKRTKQLLLDDKDNAFLSLRLFTLTSYPVATTIQDAAFDENHWNNALPLFQELEFKSFIQQAQSAQQGMFDKPVQKLHDIYNFLCITSEEELKKLCSDIKAAKACALDTETDGLDPMLANCVGISIALEEGTAYYIPFGHVVDQQQLSKDSIIQHLGPVLANATIEKYCHNAKFDQIILHQAGMPTKHITFDTLIAASLLVQDWQKKGLKELSEFYFEETMSSYSNIVTEHKAKDFSYVPLQEATWYAAADAHQTLKLKKLFEKKLEEEHLDKLFYTIEMPINDILVEMQLQGILCDTTVLSKLDRLVSKDLQAIEREINILTGMTINLNSPKQVKELLFDNLNLPPQKKSAKRTGFSTDAEVLKALAQIHPVPRLLLKYRELFKLKSTYIDSLPTFINPSTKRIHTSWNQTLVATGRLSSSNPNLQNIPTGNDSYDVDVRSAFHAEEDRVFLAADYSQIELRILAEFSKDKVLTEAFLHNQDIHAQTATKLFQIPEENITPQQRAIGKKINFSILYGLTPYGLSKDLGISYKDAHMYIETYFAQYPGVKEWMESIVAYTKQEGYTKTFFGRKRYVPGIYEKNKTLYALAKRITINTPVQGTAAELMKIGMINVCKKISDLQLDAHILLQIHDEILLSVKKSDLEKVSSIVKNTLESVVTWNIPLQVQTKSGNNWKDVTK